MQWRRSRVKHSTTEPLRSNFPVLFKADLHFKDFGKNTLHSSTFQACANSEYGVNYKLKLQTKYGAVLWWKMALTKIICLFDLILYVPSTIFQLNRNGSSWVKPVMCLAQGHNAVTLVRLKPAVSQSRVKHSTTEPLRSLLTKMKSQNMVQFSDLYLQKHNLVRNSMTLLILLLPNTIKIQCNFERNKMANAIKWKQIKIRILHKLRRNILA